MTEHQKLKEICNIIGCNGDGTTTTFNYIQEISIQLDVRVIIFTQDFMDKFRKYEESIDNGIGFFDTFDLIEEHLDNPVDYLYNLLEG